VVLLGFGGRALAISGTCSTPPDPPEAECAQIYDSTNLGAGLLGVGGALVLGGGLMMALPGERRHIEELVP
jgi:hypothetical protein